MKFTVIIYFNYILLCNIFECTLPWNLIRPYLYWLYFKYMLTSVKFFWNT